MLEGHYSELFSVHSCIVAGCTHATALLRAYVIVSFDSLVYLFEDVRLKVVVDDMTLQMIGDSVSGLARAMADAAAALLDMLSGDLKAVVSLTKTLLLASSPELLQQLHRLLCRRGWDIRTARSTKDLGIDFTCEGRSVAVVKARAQQQRKRLPRYLYLRGLGGDTAKLASTGAKPALLYGTAVVGLSTAQLESNRSLLAQMAFGKHGGSSITLQYMLSATHHDPYYDMVSKPMFMWAAAVWRGNGDKRVMEVAFQAAASLPAEQVGRMHGLGPAHATVQAIRRLGWEPLSSVRWRTRLGQVLDLREQCPMAIKRAVYPAARQVLSEALAHNRQWPALGGRHLRGTAG